MSLETTTIIGPLNLLNDNQSYTLVENEVEKNLKCLICNDTFLFPSTKDELLAHIFLKHRLVIADVEDVALLDEYFEFWGEKFNDQNLQEYCTTMLLDKLPDGTPSKDEKYFLLSDILPQDYEIRFNLHTKRLEKILEQHKFERIDQNFTRGCLYCRDVISPTRYDFLEHLYTKHYLQLGKPSNLIYINKLIDLVETKMKNLICLFCEKTFKDRATLKEHMRKKGHKRINPENKNYDKFFLINYKNFKIKFNSENHKTTTIKSYKKLSKPKTASSEKPTKEHKNYSVVSKVFQTDDSDSDWSDWEEAKQPLICLFCPITNTDYEAIKRHMGTAHEFNFDKIIENLNFYQKIKIVNYIRRKMHCLQCVSCTKKFINLTELQNHLNAEKHYCGIKRTSWDHPEFFFPTYEDDALLCYLEDTYDDDLDGNNSEDSGAVVYSEDSRMQPNPEAERLSMESFRLIEQ